MLSLYALATLEKRERKKKEGTERGPARGESHGEENKERQKIKNKRGKSARLQPRPGAGPQGAAEGGDGRKPAHRTWRQEPCLAGDLVEKLSPQDTEVEDAGAGRGGAGSAWEEGSGADGQGAAKQGSSHIVQLQ